MILVSMTSPKESWRRWGDRVVGISLLVVLWFPLLLACLLIRVTSDGPVVVVDEFLASEGEVARVYRLRTRGGGSAASRVLGVWFRRYSIDELPVVWSLARGDIRLRDVFGLFRPW